MPEDVRGLFGYMDHYAELVRIGFAGPVSVHAEYEATTPEEFRAKLKPEVEYFKKKRETALTGL